MQTTEETYELARARALAFVAEQEISPSAAEVFVDEYALVLEDRAHETRYPDLPPPTPEEVWFS